MVNLSICIPTFNRIKYLENCLNSILTAKKRSKLKIEVCISDNNSDENISTILNRYKKRMYVVTNKNNKNIGVARNIIKSVSMAKGEFVWLLGNDDLVLPNSFKYLEKLFYNNSNVDFFYINSFNIEQKFLREIKLPFDTTKINFSKFKKFSSYKFSKKKPFFSLINPFISFEFLLSMNMCIFRRLNWKKNLDAIDKKKINDKGFYSYLDNTAPHVKIWSKAFNKSTSYFLSKPLSANIHGPRGDDWGDYYPLVEGFRIPEALDCYRKNGMSFIRYYICKNYALRRFFPALFKILFNSYYKGFAYIRLWQHIIKSLLYPNVYFSGVYFFLKKVFKLLRS